VASPYTWDVSGSEPLLISDGTYDYVYGPGDVPLEQVAPRPAITLVGTASASAKATSLTLTLPVGTTVGEQVVVATTEPSTTTVKAPTGYTQVAAVTSAGSSPLATTTVFRHTVVSGDTSVKLTFSTTKTAQAAVLAVYKGVDAGFPIDVSATGSTAAAGTTVTAPSVTPANAEDQLVVFQGATGTFSAKSWTSPTGTTEEVQGNATANVSAGFADKALSFGATGAQLSSFGASANLTSVSVTLSQPHTISLVGTAVGSGTAVTLAVTLPTGLQAGDQVVLATTQPSTDAVTAPTPYTKVTSVTSTGTSPLASTTVFRHTVVAGDTSVTLTYSTKATAHAVVLAVYRGVDPNLPIDVTATASAAAGTSVVAPSVTPAYPYDQLLVFQGAVGTFSKETWSAPAGTTETVQRNSTANVSSGLAGETLGTIAATGTEASAFGASANLTTVAVAIAQPPSVLFLHHDQLGSTRLLTDSAGAVRATFTYNPYGNVNASTGNSTTAFLFAGQYRDAATGFYYLRARYYDPATGEFLTVDPDVATTLSPYGYVQGNPLNGTDPSGDCGLWGNDTCWGDAAGAIVSAAKATGSALNTALPAIHEVASVVAMGASICAVASSWTGVGGAACGAIALGASAVTAGTSDILYAEGRESEGTAVLDTVALGFSGLGAAAEAGSEAMDEASGVRSLLSGLSDLEASNAPWYASAGPWAAAKLWSISSSLYGAGANLLGGISYGMSAGALAAGAAGLFGCSNG